MTGAYLRIKRDGKWRNIEIEHLTDAERVEFITDGTLRLWLDFCCHRLVETEKLLNKLADDGIIDLEQTD